MKDIAVLNELVNNNIIPKEGTFEVKMYMVDAFYDIYRKIYPPKNAKIQKSNVKYAKKLAGLSLMKLNIARSSNLQYTKKLKVTKPKCGIIYLISNPAFPGLYKIGITRDLDKRLASYQTADPHRRYKVEHYKFVEDIKSEENKYLTLMKTNIVKGEWVNTEKVKKLFDIPAYSTW